MLWLNIFVAVDLINMIRHPFKPKSVLFYFVFSFASSFIVATLNSITYWYEYEDRGFYLGIWFVFTTVVYLITALTSIVYAYNKMRKPGISQEVR